MLENILMGFQMLFTFENILALIAGTVLGYFVGAMPGISATIGMALLIPFTFGMNALPAIIFLIAIYKASYVGDSIPGTLINTPGGAAAAATAIEGYPLCQQGKAKKALGMTIWGSGAAAILSAIMMIFLTLPVANFALSFGSPEYFLLAVMGLSVVAGLSKGNLLKGLIIAAFGVFLTTIGMDPIGGGSRFVFSFYFLEGLPFIPAVIGLFAVSEIFIIMSKKSKEKEVSKLEGEGFTFEDFKQNWHAVIKGTVLGFFVGLVPAAGANIITWLAYNEAKRTARRPELFGKGSMEGIAATEASGNSSCNGAMVPTLTLGIPGSSPLAVLMGALMLHGVQPGPLLFERNPEIPYTIFATALVAAPVMIIVGLVGLRFFAMVTLVPKSIIGGLVLGMCALGAFAISNSMFGVWVAFIFGFVGYFLRQLNIPIPPLVLALVLGRMAESEFRRSMVMSGGSPMIFFERPIAIVIILLTVLMFTTPLLQNYLRKRKDKAAQ